MSKQPESRLQRRIRATLEVEFPGSFWWKVHGGPFQKAGIPDLNGCVQGAFCALEVKRPEEPTPSAIQAHRIAEIRAAGGLACVVTSPEEAVAIVHRFLRERGRVSKTGSRVRTGETRVRVVFRPGDGKDMVQRRSHPANVRDCGCPLRRCSCTTFCDDEEDIDDDED